MEFEDLPGLDEHLERLAEMYSRDLVELSSQYPWTRPNAKPRLLPYSDLRAGDYINAHPNADGPWVHVTAVEWPPPDSESDLLIIHFKTPPHPPSGNEEWVIRRGPVDEVFVDTRDRVVQATATPQVPSLSSLSGPLHIKYCMCDHALTSHAPKPSPDSNATPCQHEDCDCSQFRHRPRQRTKT